MSRVFYTLTCMFPAYSLVELPGIEPGTKIVLTCRDAEIDYANDAKIREKTCVYAKGVDGVNTTRATLHRFAAAATSDSRWREVPP